MHRVIVLVVAFCFLSASAVLAQPANEARVRDLWETVRARKLLQDDPALANLNVGVKVVDHIGILWGPVPSAEHAQRAEQRLRLMFELVGIHNRLTIEPDETALPLAPAPPVPAAPRLDFRPEKPATALPNRSPRPTVVLGTKVELAATPEIVTTRSSPAAVVEVRRSLHIPFMGSFALPRIP